MLLGGMCKPMLSRRTQNFTRNLFQLSCLTCSSRFFRMPNGLKQPTTNPISTSGSTLLASRSHRTPKREEPPRHTFYSGSLLEVSFTQTQNRIASMSGVVSDTLDIVLSLLISNLVRGFILTYINVFQVG